ncbi:hypothetical protein [Azospirillum doebereinerae]|uniref:Uncharacterized protein n=1 Tax=Azospirillum doebereinerae TaxID=92933 RepID=A0A433J872_9PROT|nr:hypothetical protein [Azospirillum doebereinerae]MCG5241746.1 hypothetical protein [Azospirillum doebereinerae]RUQ70171.1 hypothetical protein EJ913_14310 [Azospirillum doebereinerae]
MPSTFIPTARRVDTQRLLSVAAIPLAAAVAMATTVAAVGGVTDPVAEAGGAMAFVLEFIKFCYLAVATAHLSGAITDRICGGMAAGLWLDEFDAPEPAPKEEFWQSFPNHVDGAAIAGAVTMLCIALG